MKQKKADCRAVAPRASTTTLVPEAKIPGVDTTVPRY